MGKTKPSFSSRLWREPLVRFGLVGIAIFAVNAWLSKPQPLANDSIVVEQSRIDNWSQQFRSSNGRPPNKTELDSTINQWIDEEVLYQQALLLGLHQNDSIVRRQLIQKMEFVIEGATPQPPATDAELLAFMSEQEGKYSTPEKVSFQQVFLSRGAHEGSFAEKANALLALLKQPTNSDMFRGLGNAFPLGQEIRNADDRLLRAHFGKQFVTELLKLPADNRWQGPVKSGLGLHLIRITKRTALESPKLTEVRKKVALDYRLQQEQVARRQALDTLQLQYRVEIESHSADHISGDQSGNMAEANEQ